MAEIQITRARMVSASGTANVYKLKPPMVSEQTIRKLAQQFGIRTDNRFGAFSSDAEKLVYVQQHMELTVYRASGAIRLIDRSRWQKDDRRTDLKIGDAEAQRLATTLLRKHRLNPLATERRFLDVSRLRVGKATKEGREISERTVDVAVPVQRLVDKIPVDGPGGKIVVYLDQQRNLSGFEVIWRKVGAVHRRSQTHRSPEAVIEEMDLHFRDKRGVIQVEEVRYGYFEEGRNDLQQFLQPAYIVLGMLTSPESTARKRTIFVASALMKPIGRLTPPLEPKAPQRPRPEPR
jgi:hypothetical protein